MTATDAPDSPIFGNAQDGLAVAPTPVPTNPAWAATSLYLDAWSDAFVAAVGRLTDIVRDKEAEVQMKSGGKYTYKFSNLADVMQIVRPTLAEDGLVVSQSIGTTGRNISVWTTVHHRSGQFVTFNPVEMFAGDTPQTVGTACTYGRRYSVKAALGLADDDDDGAAATEAAKRQNEGPTEPTAPQEPQFITARQVDAANKRYAEDGASTEDVVDWVMEATNGRTAKLEEVYGSELVGLRDARQAWLNRTAAPTEAPIQPTLGGDPPLAAIDRENREDRHGR